MNFRLKFIVMISFAFFAYIGVAHLVAHLVHAVDSHIIRYVIALLPVLPLSLGIIAVFRFFRHLDELFRRIILEGVVFSLCINFFLFSGIGNLQKWATFPDLSMTYISEMLFLMLIPGIIISFCRYR